MKFLASLLLLRRSRCRRIRRRSIRGLARLSRRCRLAAHSFLEFADSLAEAFHHFRNLAPPEKHEDNDRNNQQMHGAIPHGSLPFTPGPRPDAANSYSPVQSITRSSPTLRVTCSRSRNSSSGMAYFRLTPATSLNATTVIRSPRSFLYFAIRLRRPATAVR